MSTGKNAASRAANAAVRAAAAAVSAVDAAGDGGADEAEVDKELGPLFSLSGAKAEKHDRTLVHRLEPIDEGMIGQLPPDATEVDISRRWGGGTFKLQAVDAPGQYLKQMTLRIAGDPIFENDLSQKKYDKWVKSNYGSVQKDATGNFVDPVALEEARHQRELGRIKAEQDSALARLKAEMDAKDAAEERRRSREREDRRAEAEEREAKENARREHEREERAEERRQEREARERELAAQRAHEAAQREADREERRLEREARGDPMAQFVAMAQVVTAMQGGGHAEAGPWDVAARLPEILEGVAKTGTAVYDEVQARRKRERPHVERTRGGLHLDGPTAAKAVAAMKAIERAGGDPEKVFERVFDNMSKVKAAEEPKKTLRIGKPKNGARKALPARSKKVAGQIVPAKSAAPAPAPVAAPKAEA